MKRLLVGLAALLAMVAPSLGQGRKFQDLPAASFVSPGDLFAIDQGAGFTSRNATALQVSTFVYSTLGGDCTVSSYVITCSKTGGVNFGTLATANAASPPALGTGTPNAGHFSTLSATGLVTTAAATTGSSGLNLSPGVAPTTPVNGDVWITAAGMYVRANGVTVGPLGTGGTGCVTSGASIVYGDGAGGCTNVVIGSYLTFSGGTLSGTGGLTVGASITGSCVSGYNIFNNGGVLGCQPNGGGGGTVTTSGSPSTGNLTKFSSASAITNGDLSGAVTTSGTLATTLATNAVGTSNIANSAVTLAKIANASANSKLLGAGAAGIGAAYTELTLGTNLSMSGTTLNATGGGTPGGSNGQLQINNSGAFGGVTIGPTLVNNSGTLDVAGSVVAGTTQTVTTGQWSAGTTFVVTTAAQTLTLPVSSTLSANGGIAIQTIGQSVTLAPNAADAINGGTGGASQTISAGLTAYVTTNGSGAIRVSPTSAAGSGTVTSVICGTGLSGGTITSTGTCSLNLGNANAWTGQQSFVSVLGSENAQSGTTYTLVATDCGKTVSFSNASAVTVTIPASIVPAAGTTCNIIIRQDGAGQVAVNGSAVSAATLVTHVASSAATKTAGAHAVIGLQLSTISSVATAVLTGDGA